MKSCHLQQHGWSQRVKKVRQKRQKPYDLTHVWNLRNKTNKQTNKQKTPRETKKQTLKYREQTDGRQRGGGGGEVRRIKGIKSTLILLCAG